MSRAVVVEMLGRGFRALAIEQKELASRLGVHPSTVNKWLSGSQLPQPKIVPLVATTLGLDERELSQAIMAAQQDETRNARRVGRQAKSQLERVLDEMGRVVQENRDINDQIGRDIHEINVNFAEMTKQFRQMNQTLLRVAKALDARSAEDSRSN